ncbi:hypothetical protein [Reinekea marinisedimentorum]|uniref:Uncharacterized protein n=1 Tax=Reinekea marinisedimentorum TaxID=230495 RepID=A0A4V6NY59_9GAMM|nr:hypothetical protein [Reinekea marinisedimentorum]TCS44093.1 hypothetical protein BCF53_101436 [Reinekea marinisedimentorum]
MSVHVRLLQLEMYLPHVATSSDLQKALGPLKRFCKNQHNIALAVEPFKDADRGCFSLVITGTDKRAVEQESEHMMSWLEANITGQSLASNVAWL